MQLPHYTFVFRSTIPRPADEIFHWHMRRGSVQRALPPWKKIKVLEEGETRVSLLLHICFFWKKWILERRLGKNVLTEIQIQGPFKRWEHLCKVLPREEKTCELTDRITLSFPLPFFKKKIHKELHRALAGKHEVLAKDLATYARYPQAPLRILLSGSTGFLGRHLKAFLLAGGHEVICLVHSQKRVGKEMVYWNPAAGEIDPRSLQGFDAVIHLAGENILGRWSKKKKEAIFLSRCRDSWLLSQALSRLEKPPQTVISASAIGFYGNRGEELLTEKSLSGKGYLADVCVKWEEALSAVRDRGVRVVHTRFGAILSPSGGMLGKMLPLFRLGLGGKMGRGDQIVSWIHLDDAIGALYHLLMRQEIFGPVNVVSPHAVSQEQFTVTLAERLGRCAVMRIPAFCLRALMGEMADEVLLASTHALPERLRETDYHFRYPHLKEALRV